MDADAVIFQASSQLSSLPSAICVVINLRGVLRHRAGRGLSEIHQSRASLRYRSVVEHGLNSARTCFFYFLEGGQLCILIAGCVWVAAQQNVCVSLGASLGAKTNPLTIKRPCARGLLCCIMVFLSTLENIFSVCLKASAETFFGCVSACVCLSVLSVCVPLYCGEESQLAGSGSEWLAQRVSC